MVAVLSDFSVSPHPIREVMPKYKKMKQTLVI